jgi:hypothetical protein
MAEFKIYLINTECDAYFYHPNLNRVWACGPA